MKKMFLSTAGMTVFCLLATCLQGHEIDWHTTASGGGACVGGAYQISATIGQSAVGMVGGERFEVAPGYWVVVYLLDEGEGPRLRIASRDGLQAVLAWPVDWEGFRLEYSASLTPPDWQPEADAVEEEGEWRADVTLPSSGARYYRLRRTEGD